MTVTSLSFLAMVLVGVIIYYLIPGIFQWVVLLILSCIFYCYAATPYTILCIIISVATAYFSTSFFVKNNELENADRNKKIVLTVSILINVILWFVFKAKGIWAPVIYRALFFNRPIADRIISFELIGALGMGYYTLQTIGYIVDCYWGNARFQRNPFKLFLFVSYFPQMTVGPISKYSKLSVIYERHVFLYKNISFGSQRILWGFFKKLVIAERVGLIVSEIISNPSLFRGIYSWAVILLYPIQMYCDFSGCMDIILGVSELFDIHLEENFRNPFFARSSQEFWQRWHITLGAWAREYVLYPFLKTKGVVSLGKKFRSRFGRKKGKFIISCMGMFFTWMVIGIWHGGFQYIIGVSLWYWIVIMIEDYFSESLNKVNKKLGIKTESFSWHFFQSVRTYLIYAIGASFFCLGVRSGIKLLTDAIKVFTGGKNANWWVLFGDVEIQGVSFLDINLIIIGIALLIIVGILREKHLYAREWMQSQCFAFRWIVWIVLLVIVVVYGKYGPGYDATEFIYQAF